MILRYKIDNKYFCSCSMCEQSREISQASYYKYNPTSYSKDAVCIKCRKILDTFRTKEDIEVYKLKWQRENRERHNIASRKSYQNNIEVARYKGRIRRLSRKNKLGKITEEDYFKLILSTDKCATCHTSIMDKRYEIDHIIPYISGGTNDISNLQLLCQFCNRSKGAKPLEKFMKHLELIKNE